MDNNLEKIQQFFDGEMSEREHQTFQNQIVKDPLLKAEVEEYQSMVKGIEKFGMKQVLDQVDLPTQDSVKKTGKAIWLVVSLLLLASIALLFVLKLRLGDEGEASNPRIEYAALMPTLEGLPITLSDDANLLSEGMIAYRMEEYAKASQLFQSLMDDGIVSDTVKIYYANSLIEQGELSSALEQLNSINRDEGSSFNYEAQWYTAKAHLLNNDEESGIAILNKLVEQQNPYTSLASEIISKIEASKR